MPIARSRVAHPAKKKKRRSAKAKRGRGGIEPPTSPTLKENHTTRPTARTSEVTIRARPHKTTRTRGKKKIDYKGAAGIEPAPSGSAILRSTAELCTRNPWHGCGCGLRNYGEGEGNKKVLPGLEPGLKESESLVMTITL